MVKGSETPERISMKLEIYNHVVGMPKHANPCGAETTWMVWANTWKNTLWFLRYTFFALFFGLRRASTSGPIFTIYTSYDVFPPKDVPFGVLVHTAPILGAKSPYLGSCIGIFKLIAQNTIEITRRLQSNFAQSQRPPNALRGWSQRA